MSRSRRPIPDPCRSCANLIFLPLSRSRIGVCGPRYDLRFNPTTCRSYIPIEERRHGQTPDRPTPQPL